MMVMASLVLLTALPEVLLDEGRARPAAVATKRLCRSLYEIILKTSKQNDVSFELKKALSKQA